MGTIDIDWMKLMHNHYSYDDIHRYVTNIPRDETDENGKVIKFGMETCCIQISYALIQADGPMQLLPGETGRMDQTGKMRFIISVPSMHVYLDRVYPSAEQIDPNITAARDATFGRKGIMIFGNRHCDLWNGDNIHRPAMYNSQIWIHKSVQDNGLFFWEVPYSEALGF